MFMTTVIKCHSLNFDICNAESDITKTTWLWIDNRTGRQYNAE